MEPTILFVIRLFFCTTFFYVALNFYFRYQVRVDFSILLGYLLILAIGFDLLDKGIRLNALWQSLILILLYGIALIVIHRKGNYPVFLVGLRKNERILIEESLRETFPSEENYRYQENNWFYLVLRNVSRKQRNTFLSDLEKKIQKEPKQLSIALYISMMLALFLMVYVWRFM